MIRIESFLSARLFMAPQLVGDSIYFISDLSGRLSLYRMQAQPDGSVPEPLLPGHISVQNPHLIGGYPYYVFPKLGKILIMLDQDGDENYQPMLIPLNGGYPEPAFGDKLAGTRCHLGKCDTERNLVYLLVESRSEAMQSTQRGNLETASLEELARSQWGQFPDGVNADHTKVILNEGYTPGDNVLYLWENGSTRLLYGTPLEQRQAGEQVTLPAIFNCEFTAGDRACLVRHSPV